MKLFRKGIRQRPKTINADAGIAYSGDDAK